MTETKVAVSSCLQNKLWGKDFLSFPIEHSEHYLNAGDIHV